MVRTNKERSLEMRAVITKLNSLGINYSRISVDSGLNKASISKFVHGKLDYSDALLDRVDDAIEKYKVLL